MSGTDYSPTGGRCASLYLLRWQAVESFHEPGSASVPLACCFPLETSTRRRDAGAPRKAQRFMVPMRDSAIVETFHEPGSASVPLACCFPLEHPLAGETPALPGRPSGSWSQCAILQSWKLSMNLLPPAFRVRVAVRWAV